MLLSDSDSSGSSGGSAPLLGDALVIAGTLGCALSNVGEFLVVMKKKLVAVIYSRNFCILLGICKNFVLWKRSVCFSTWTCQVSFVVAGMKVANLTLDTAEHTTGILRSLLRASTVGE
ncbi:uncharacterized protein LOC113326406 [Papaver somniferum]|uniref:uncharacterized protein LOC113326406 n=1 Tax=Papaver somniferum TaxID=3469 RepID=UPI000E6F94AA|nr:uncharacterized protein LOC113326406 [Papaver somniferum]